MFYEILRLIEIVYKLFLLGILLGFGYLIYTNTRGGLMGLAIAYTGISTIAAPYIYFKIFPEDPDNVLGFVSNTAGLAIFTAMVLAIGMALVILASAITGEDPFTPYIADF